MVRRRFIIVARSVIRLSTRPGDNMTGRIAWAIFVLVMVVFVLGSILFLDKHYTAFANVTVERLE